MLYSMKHLFLVILIICNSVLAFAQTTKVKGVVTDASTGEALPFVNVYFLNTTIGVTTDFNGYYYLETRSNIPGELNVMLLGYESKTAKVIKGGFNELNFALNPTSISLNAITVKPNDSYIRSILKNISNNKKYNNPEEQALFNCKIYSKMELDLTNIKPELKNKKLQKSFGFVFKNMDTSVISGQAFLPIMITESNAQYYHQKEPLFSREIIKASRISGIKEDYSLAQFTGHLHAKINLYNNYIDIFNIKFASPLSDHGSMFYNYFLIDSLKIDGRQTYKIRFHPKMHSAPVLDGEINIDSATFALQSAHVKMIKKLNVNWIRDLVIDTKSELINDSIWFYKQDKLYVDFSVTMRDSSKVISFLGNRQVDYSNVDFKTPIPKEILKLNNNVVINEDVLKNDDNYWEKVRPYELSKKEQNIYKMVDSIKHVPLYHNIYTIVNTILTGYYNTKYIGIGPYYKLLSFNNLEGLRFQLGMRTTSDLSKKFRLTGYAAYGTKDETFKGGGTLEYAPSRQPTRKFTLSFKRDAIQLGAGIDAFTEGNILSSLLSRGNSQRLSLVNKGLISYEHEWTEGLSNVISFETRRVASNKYVPMYTPDSTCVNSVHSAAINLSTRISWDEVVSRDYFDKLYLFTEYPVITLDVSIGLKGIFKNSYNFYRIEGGIHYAVPIPPIGTSYFTIKGGCIFGKVPYPMLKLHEGNGTYFNNPSAFSCMEFYEFASDAWVSLFYQHNFKGFFLGKIPLLKNLKWREAISIKGVYGTLSKKNNLEKPILLFPEGMSDLKKPYVEMGVGITNIFRIFRVDTYWRLTHRYKETGEKNNNFVVNFGIELNF